MLSAGGVLGGCSCCWCQRGGEIVYFELPGNDAEATQRFWSSLFGWTFTQGNTPDYSMIHGSDPLGGSQHGDPSQHPRVFFGVDDITAATTRVRELGGTAEQPVTIPAGAFVRCTDDQGVQFSLFEAARRPVVPAESDDPRPPFRRALGWFARIVAPEGRDGRWMPILDGRPRNAYGTGEWETRLTTGRHFHRGDGRAHRRVRTSTEERTWDESRGRSH